MSQNANLPLLSRSLAARTLRSARKAALESRGLAGGAIIAILLSAPAASAATAALCESAARTAARLTGASEEMLVALARTESGRARGGHLHPWPWTVNIAGDGEWFDSRESAIAHVRAAIRAGKRNVDIGCFQINHHWHASAFASLDQMFDPTANALYAARFLNRLQREFGNWEDAVGAYHSRTPKLATRYIARFRKHLDTPDDGLVGGAQEIDLAHKTATRAPRRPTQTATPYPLLVTGAAPALGSLVPADAVASRGGLLIPATGIRK